MSTDIRLAFKCPHETLEERVFLSADRRSLPTTQPVAAESSVRLRIDEDIEVPRYGLHSQAQLTSSRSGPYTILPNETTLTVSSKTGSVTVELDVGSRQSTDDLVATFNEVFLDQDLFAENVNGHLTFSDIGSLGVQSEVVITGTAATLLGFIVSKRSRGKMLFPGWALHRRFRADGSLLARYPKFVSPVRANPIFKVDYITAQSRCRRCATKGVENDFRSDTLGDTFLIQDENLLHQAALKILLTTKGSNPNHTWYGSSLRSRIGAKAIGAVSSQISEDVRRALENMQRTQTAQARYQPVSAKERLLTIESVQTIVDNNDPTRFLVDVLVRNASQQQVNLSVFYTVGGTTAFVNNARVF